MERERVEHCARCWKRQQATALLE